MLSSHQDKTCTFGLIQNYSQVARTFPAASEIAIMYIAFSCSVTIIYSQQQPILTDVVVHGSRRAVYKSLLIYEAS